MATCKVCGNPQSECFEHCHAPGSNGEHVPDFSTAQLLSLQDAGEYDRVTVDIWCAKCGGGGSAVVEAKDIMWS